MRRSHVLAVTALTCGIFWTSAAAAQLDRRSILAEVQRTVPAIRRCWERMVRSPPASAAALAGRIDLHVTVRADGRVRKVKVRRSDFRNSAFERCVVRRASRMRFPAAGQQTVFVYPFIFRPPS